MAERIGVSRFSSGYRIVMYAVLTLPMALAAGCDAFNPAFLSAVGVDTVGPSTSGHVVVVFRNDTRFDSRLIEHLRSRGVAPELLEESPRVQFVVRITFVNGRQLDVEFRDGSRAISAPTLAATCAITEDCPQGFDCIDGVCTDPNVDLSTLPELTRDDLDNIVVQCDVARVQILEPTLAVFVPAFFETTRIDPGDENTRPFRVRVNIVTPRFQVLRRDDVDAQGNVTLRRNFDIREAPAPALPLCGSVVAITLSGTLTLPFEVNSFGDNLPGTLNTNIAEAAESPGRFRMLVSLR